MEQLLSDLTNGTTEYRENGEVIRHPPNTIMLRAARTLKQLVDQANGLARTSESLTHQNQQLLNEISTLRDTIDKHNRLDSDNSNANDVRSVNDTETTNNPSATIADEPTVSEQGTQA